MHTLTPTALQEWLLSERTKPLLLDVRETWEFGICHIDGAQSMPMADIPHYSEKLDQDAAIVLICHHGRRSYEVGLFLEQQGFSELYNLVGGVAGWAKEIDSGMPTY